MPNGTKAKGKGCLTQEKLTVVLLGGARLLTSRLAGTLAPPESANCTATEKLAVLPGGAKQGSLGGVKPILRVLVAVCLAPIAVATAADTFDIGLKQLLEDFQARRPSLAAPTNLTLPDALAFQQRFVAQLTNLFGPPVGYKVGLVSEATQQRYGARAPVRGVLLRDMMLKDGAEVPANFGARPVFEADFIAVVKDEGINSAKTQLEAARHLSELVAFIELPDLLISTNRPPSATALTAANVGARLGVLGQRVPVTPTQEFVDALGNLNFILTDETGQELVRAKGSVMLGHPLNVVTWLVQDLAASGLKLKAGDLISLGSVATPITPKAGQTLKLRYEGLPGGVFGASVQFRVTKPTDISMTDRAPQEFQAWQPVKQLHCS